MSHLYYASIVFLVTFLAYRPFITKLDIMKYILLGALSFIAPFVNNHHSNHQTTFNVSGNVTSSMYPLVTATPNYSNMNNKSTYLLMDAIVISVLGAFSVSICGLFTRWHFPITFIKPNSNAYLSGFMRHGISIGLISLATMSQFSSDCNLSLALTIIGSFWYICGPYFIRRWKAISVITAISSLFSFFICRMAHSNSLLHNLSLMDCVLYAATLVIACSALDYLDTLLNTYPHLVESNKLKQANFQKATTASYWIAVCRLLVSMPSESELHPSPVEDLATAIRVLGPASRSWKTMAALFPTNLRQDLCLLYAFFRTADDLVDDAPTPQQCEANLVTIRKFLRDIYFPTTTATKFEMNRDTDPTLPAHINWDQYASLLPSDDVLAIFRNFARIAHYLCPRAMSELTDAWELDLRGAPVKKQKDLLNYAALISGTFGELCTCVIMYKTGRGNWGQQKNNVARNDQVLSRARATGQCLQLINIARDVIADSLVGRCYVPLQYMPYPSQSMYYLLKVARTPMQVGEQTLKSFSLRILGLADQISDKAQKGIDGLPDEVQDSIRAAFEIYMAIGPTLRNDPGFPLRAKVPKRQQQWIALRCIYGFRGPVARAISSTFYEVVSVYTRAFASLSNTRKGQNIY